MVRLMNIIGSLTSCGHGPIERLMNIIGSLTSVGHGPIEVNIYIYICPTIKPFSWR